MVGCGVGEGWEVQVLDLLSHFGCFCFCFPWGVGVGRTTIDISTLPSLRRVSTDAIRTRCYDSRGSFPGFAVDPQPPDFLHGLQDREFFCDFYFHCSLASISGAELEVEIIEAFAIEYYY